MLASLGAHSVQESPSCLSGQGILVGVIDSGVDYTHTWLGGTNGTIHTYQAAYGSSVTSVENQRRDGLFPTARVVEGYDFVGDLVNGQTPQPVQRFVQVDDDPIDAHQGHGTSVAAAVLRVAPQAQIVAAKACFTATTSSHNGSGGCPEFAVLQSLEYMLDIHRDGSQRQVHIVNGTYLRAVR